MLSHGTLLQNRYRIGRRIGQGGMGAVYEATHEELGHTVALKETFHTDDERLRRAFKREARMLAGLQHPGLPRVIDYFADGDGLFLVMEYIGGDDLLVQLQTQQQPFAVSEVIRWGEQLLDVLEYLHAQDPSVIHRDIKPNNIKLNRRGDAILLDFGLSKGAGGETTSLVASRSVLGFTLTYAPLEQILKADQNLVQYLAFLDAERVSRLLQTPTDARSDLYALGATLYHLLTNKLPAQAPMRAQAVWSGKVDPLLPAHEVNSQILPAISDILHKAMALDGPDRWPGATAMRAELTDVLRHLSQPTEPLPQPTPPSEETLPSGDSPPAPPPPDEDGQDADTEQGVRPRPWLPEGMLRRWPFHYALPVAAALLLLVIGSVVFLRSNSSPPESAPANQNAAPTPTPPLGANLRDDEFIPFRRGDKWGFCRADKELLIKPEYDDVRRFSEGLAAVAIMESDPDRVRNDAERVKRGYKPASKRIFKWGYINKLGELVIPIELDGAYLFKGGVAQVRYQRQSQSRDKAGNVIPPPSPQGTPSAASKPTPASTPDPLSDPIPEPARRDSYGTAVTYRYTRDGKTAFGGEFEEASYFYERRARVKTGGVYGFIKPDGKYAVNPDYQDASFFSQGLAAVKLKDGNWGFIDIDGDKSIGFDYEDVGDKHNFPFKNGFAKVKRKGQQWELIDTNGRQVLESKYEDIKWSEAGLAAVKSENKWGIIDINAKGAKLTDFKYDGIDFSDDNDKGFLAYLKSLMAYVKEG
ncbi:MAG TPA: WG repeat-containing protein, partial [Pyrinomonadaceae bacterium]